MGLGEYVGYVLFIVSLIVLGAALYQLHRGGYSREALRGVRPRLLAGAVLSAAAAVLLGMS